MNFTAWILAFWFAIDAVQGLEESWAHDHLRTHAFAD